MSEDLKIRRAKQEGRRPEAAADPADQRQGRTESGPPGGGAVRPGTPAAAPSVARFRCDRASVTIRHPFTGAVIMQLQRGDVREADEGSDHFNLLVQAGCTRLDAPPAREIRRASYRTFQPAEAAAK